MIFRQQHRRLLPTMLGLCLSALLLSGLKPALSWAGSMQIESGKMLVQHKNNQVVFTLNVHLKRDDFELFCDRLVAYYNDNDLERAEAFGNIRLRRGKVHGTSDKAVLDQKNNTITLIGHAVLQQAGNRLEGEKIIHHINDETTIVTPAKGGRTHMTIESGDNNDVLPSSDNTP